VLPHSRQPPDPDDTAGAASGPGTVGEPGPSAAARPPGTSRHEWEQPGAYRVADGVHRIPLPLPNDGLRAVNVHAIEDAGQLVMIDSGWALAQARELLEAA